MTNRSAAWRLTPLALALTGLCAPMALANDRPDPTNLDRVVVRSAAGFEQAIADAPASISVVTREELEKKAYVDITDAVENIPGLYVTGGGNMQDISVRGMTPAYTLFLVDGRPVSAGRSVNTNGADGGKQIGLPPLAMIERIEVIRGPMSSLYGSEAMGGVVNVITRATPRKWGGSLGLDYTSAHNDVSNDAFNSNFYLGGPLVDDVLGLQVNGSYHTTDESDYAGGSDSAASTPESKRRTLGTRLTWQANEANRLALSWDTSRLDYTHTPGRSVAEDATGSYYRYDKDVFALTHDGHYGNLAISTYLQHDISDRVQEKTKKEEVTMLNTQATWFGERHTYTFGGRYKVEDFVDETNGLLTSDIPGAVRSVDRWIGAVFAEAEWRLHEDFNLTTGLRYDDDELFGGHVSPRVYGNWHFTDNLTFKGGISTGYTQPSLAAATEGFGRGTGGGGSPAPHPRALIIGNPDLEPESSVNYELGFVYDNGPAGLTAALMAFRTDYKDKIAEDRYCDNGGDRNDPSTWSCPFGGNNYLFLSTRKNIDEAQIEGVELSLDWWPAADVRLSTSYTFTDSEQQTGEFAGEPLNKMPRHMANVGLDWTATDRLSLWLQGNYRGETSDFLGRTSMSSGTPGYALADAGLVYRLNRRARVKLGLYNITDRTVTNDAYGVVLDGRRVTAGLTLDF
ncbi:TonB-dependent receptor domain-containing protein [Luteimonas sp. JM171]|uniref:TonB-dependent receptor domain-containing protein n=1 Tax=Luteimonas sp. JM171 TaxID=1896164 RepID=UPI00085923BD|nr:TonB-dependent receptor [Luteimonas sp. JM171]AOH36157.1 ligand-gated channel protein [Luteimonas sp. JM171]